MAKDGHYPARWTPVPASIGSIQVPVEIANRVADIPTRPEDLGVTDTEGFVGLGGPWRRFRHKHGFVSGNAVFTSVTGKKDPKKYEDLGRDWAIGELGISG